MSALQITYDEARKLMKPGDVIAFGGSSNFSEIIKFATYSSVSHVGTILHTKIPEDNTDRFFNQIVESTSSKGVAIARFSERLEEYDGDLWWLPLKKEIRDNSFDQVKFFNFLFNQVKQKKPYDLPQAVKSAVDALDNLPFETHGPGYNKEDFSKFFCSELVSAALEIAGATGSVNASEVTPIDLCRWALYEDSYYQLKGDSSTKISRFNTAPPENWNE